MPARTRAVSPASRAEIPPRRRMFVIFRTDDPDLLPLRRARCCIPGREWVRASSTISSPRPLKYCLRQRAFS
jgi:hypothetical protein